MKCLAYWSLEWRTMPRTLRGALAFSAARRRSTTSGSEERSCPASSREARHRVSQLPLLLQPMLHDRAARLRRSESRESRHHPVEDEADFARVVSGVSRLEQHLLQVIEQGQKRDLGPLVLQLAQGRHGLLDERRRKAQDGMPHRGIEVFVGGDVACRRDPPQEVEEVAPEVPFLVPLPLPERRSGDVRAPPGAPRDRALRAAGGSACGAPASSPATARSSAPSGSSP